MPVQIRATAHVVICFQSIIILTGPTIRKSTSANDGVIGGDDEEMAPLDATDFTGRVKGIEPF